MSATDVDDRRLLNEIAERARHEQELQDLRDQQHKLRTRLHSTD